MSWFASGDSLILYLLSQGHCWVPPLSFKSTPVWVMKYMGHPNWRSVADESIKDFCRLVGKAKRNLVRVSTVCNQVHPLIDLGGAGVLDNAYQIVGIQACRLFYLKNWRQPIPEKCLRFASSATQRSGLRHFLFGRTLLLACYWALCHPTWCPLAIGGCWALEMGWFKLRCFLSIKCTLHLKIEYRKIINTSTIFTLITY